MKRLICLVVLGVTLLFAPIFVSYAGEVKVMMVSSVGTSDFFHKGEDSSLLTMQEFQLGAQTGEITIKEMSKKGWNIVSVVYANSTHVVIVFEKK